MASVLLGKQHLVCRYPPVYAKRWDIPSDTALALRGVELVTLVLELGGLAENAETMGKTPRDEELAVVLAGEFY